MTHKHPLTDDLCYQIWQDNKDNWIMWQEPCPSTRRLIRAAVDWQMEQVLKWLKEHAAEYAYEDYYGPCFNDNGLLDDLEEAMRPQQQKENN